MPIERHGLTPGTGVLLYTDEVAEAGRKAELFGQTRLAKSIQTLRGLPLAEVVAAVTTEVREFAAAGLADDLCVVAARIGEN